MLRDLKYLLAYAAPASTFLALTWQGAWSFATVVMAFVLIPIAEQFAGGTTKNLSEEEETEKAVSPIFDLLLYLNVPILLGLLWLYFPLVTGSSLATYETIGLTMSMGVVMSTIGINVAHELGHRLNAFEQFLSKILLTTTLYTQFHIEHNRGHHLWVATPEDPSSARLGENLYSFWLRSMSGVYLNAWRLENDRLRRAGQPALSVQNEMLWYHVAQLGYLGLVLWLFGWVGVGFAVAVALLGILQLETVNYIEHYGLNRKQLASGRYEKVSPQHSWNSNHEVGRIFLYELTRHSDHHFKSTRKYQVLRHFDESPQLPHGYPASMLMAMLPPLWFSVMNERVQVVQGSKLFKVQAGTAPA